jgi:DNA-binding response OmpR family regulator
VSAILIIDDDLDLGDLTRRRLQRMGLVAKLHASSRGAMDLLLHDDFDLVILDVNMPGLSGPEVMKMIRMVRPGGRIKVMFYSSTDPTELRRLSELHGADGYLSKSATAQEFEFRIRDLLRARPRSDEARSDAVRSDVAPPSARSGATRSGADGSGS